MGEIQIEDDSIWTFVTRAVWFHSESSALHVLLKTEQIFFLLFSFSSLDPSFNFYPKEQLSSVTNIYARFQEKLSGSWRCLRAMLELSVVVFLSLLSVLFSFHSCTGTEGTRWKRAPSRQMVVQTCALRSKWGAASHGLAYLLWWIIRQLFQPETMAMLSYCAGTSSYAVMAEQNRDSSS